MLFFGTYDATRHPRVAVLREGVAASGHAVDECNVPLGLDTTWRVRLARRPWLAPLFAARLAGAWAALWWRARRLPEPDAVVVGYMGQFDVRLARRLWRRTPIVLDYMVSLADTVEDRAVGSPRLRSLLERVDRGALRRADIVCVDTEEHRKMLPAEVVERACVIPVGAPSSWWVDPADVAPPPVHVVFFGLFTPLQGAPTIGAAIALLADDERIRFTMVGQGQDLGPARAAAGSNARVEWTRWVDAGQLPAVVAGHHVCLGVFGVGPKASRVVPNKVFQGAAAGCAIVTGDTPPQRRALGDDAVYVPLGDAPALAAALQGLADDPARLAGLRSGARRRAEAQFRPEAVAAGLETALAGVAPS